MIAAALALLLAASPQSAPQAFYEVAWHIVEAAPAEEGRVVTVRPGELFMRARLLPESVARLEADLVDGSGKTMIAKGSELIGAHPSLRIYCDVQQRGPGLGGVLMGAPAMKQVCLMDADRDGRFDSYFAARSTIKGVPFLSGRVPKKPQGTTSLAYSIIDPATMASSFFVALKYEGKPLLYDRRNFRLTFGIDKRTEQLSDWFYTSGSTYPQQQRYLGGSFTVLAERDGALDIRLDRPFPAQPFAVMKTVEFHMY